MLEPWKDSHKRFKNIILLSSGGKMTWKCLHKTVRDYKRCSYLCLHYTRTRGQPQALGANILKTNFKGYFNVYTVPGSSLKLTLQEIMRE